MKTYFRTFAATVLLITFFMNSTFAQDLAKNQTVNLNTSKVATAANDITGSGNNRIDTKFATRFPLAQNEQWSVDNKGYWVSFTTEGRKTRAGFTSNGQLNYIITSCTLNQLSTDFQTYLTKNYVGYQLLNAIEIDAFAEKTQQAILESATGFVTLASTKDGIEEIQKMTKSN